jgi:hypothetical protein
MLFEAIVSVPGIAYRQRVFADLGLISFANVCRL